MKKRIKRYAGRDESLVEIEERSIKSPRLMQEELAKGPMDYATMGKRSGAASTMSGPREDIRESVSESEYEPPQTSKMPSGVASGFKAKDYLEEIGSKGGGPRSETKPAVAKKKKPAPKQASQSFNVDESGIEERRKTSASSDNEPPLAKIGRAIKGTFEERGRSNKSMFTPRMKSGGKVSSASSRADGIAQRGKTRGRMC
jgi:hypothetical protein